MQKIFEAPLLVPSFPLYYSIICREHVAPHARGPHPARTPSPRNLETLDTLE